MLHDMVEQTITKLSQAEALAAPAAKRPRDARQPLLDALLEAAVAGARAIAAAGPQLIRFKADGTPQAGADLASDEAVRAVLARRLPDLPIVSEEGARDLPRGFASRPFLLVDPLDGTREFMEGHPDHAVCLALIERRRPVAGVILAPLRGLAWLAGEIAVEVSLGDGFEPRPETARRLSLPQTDAPPQRLAVSRSRPDASVRRLFPAIADANVLPIGAVLKLVAIARGEACVFPTRNPSSEWDIAAGEALVLAAGGAMLGLDGRPLTYGRSRSRFLHEPYVAARSGAIARQAIGQAADQWPAC
jgi:3'(2'), 5'-bisphosphate nucleotidase